MFHIKGHQSAQHAAEHRTSFHFKGRLGGQSPHSLCTIDVSDKIERPFILIGRS